MNQVDPKTGDTSAGLSHMISRTFRGGFELASTYNEHVVGGYYAAVRSKLGVGL